jgi:hypothetical protein
MKIAVVGLEGLHCHQVHCPRRLHQRAAEVSRVQADSLLTRIPSGIQGLI